MPTTRRWLAAWLLALALLPGLERGLLAHDHASASPVAQLAAAPEAAAAGVLQDCFACHARASLSAMAIDAHPERHGAAPPELILAPPAPAPLVAQVETPYVRGPPPQIA
jgi:hypothetical protein